MLEGHRDKMFKTEDEAEIEKAEELEFRKEAAQHLTDLAAEILTGEVDVNHVSHSRDPVEPRIFQIGREAPIMGPWTMEVEYERE